MATLQMSEDTARKMYPTASAEMKEVLQETFGKDFFSQKITDRVKTWEDACKIKGINPEYLPYPVATNGDERAANAFFKMNIIREVLNEGWTPDWNNSNEYKYYPWFKMGSSGGGGGFSYHYCDYGRTLTCVGARLVFKSQALAVYAGNQFVEIYKDFMTI